jgi:hypothetical protein
MTRTMVNKKTTTHALNAANCIMQSVYIYIMVLGMMKTRNAGRSALAPHMHYYNNNRVATVVTPALATVPSPPASASAIQWPNVVIEASIPSIPLHRGATLAES